MDRVSLIVGAALMTAFCCQFIYAASARYMLAADHAWPIIFWLILTAIPLIAPISLGFMAGAISR